MNGLPTPGNTITVVMVDGVGATQTVSYTAIQGDSVTSVSNALLTLINAGSLFTAVLFTLFTPDIGLRITQNSSVDESILTVTVTISETDGAQTLTFNEKDNAFESFLSLRPEMMCTIGNLLCAWKDGQMWSHDNTRYNSFFGVDYESSITPVFNDNPLMDKTFQALMEKANTIWDCPEIVTQSNSYGSTPQQSNLVAAEFVRREGKFTASFKRDTNSRGGKLNGATLKGSWCKIKFRKQTANDLVTLEIAQVSYIESNLNNR